MHCTPAVRWGKMRVMHRMRFFNPQSFAILLALGFASAVPRCAADEPSPAATAAFNSYIGKLEARLTQQHRSATGFIAGVSDPTTAARLRKGELIVEKVTPADNGDVTGAMLHHWRGTAFVPGATAADFERLMRDYSAYPRKYAPQVLSARAMEHDGDHYQVTMRVRQKHVITVVMDTAYDVTFGRLDAKHGYSLSRSTRIAEMAEPGTANERALSAGEQHGFLWRLDSYWSYEERDGGLYLQIESVSLTRSIPAGLGWAIGPFVESVPRESLEFTLQATRNALRR